VAIIQSKRLRNKIAGFTTHLMKRIQRGPVRALLYTAAQQPPGAHRPAHKPTHTGPPHTGDRSPVRAPELNK
jgi:hypothetical protein